MTGEKWLQEVFFIPLGPTLYVETLKQPGVLTGAYYHTLSPQGLGPPFHPLSQHQQGAWEPPYTDKPSQLKYHCKGLRN